MKQSKTGTYVGRVSFNFRLDDVDPKDIPELCSTYVREILEGIKEPDFLNHTAPGDGIYLDIEPIGVNHENDR